MTSLNSLFAIVGCADDKFPDEGLIAVRIHQSGLTVPLISADREKMQDMLQEAQKIATSSGRRLQLIEFTTRVLIMEVTP